jgi:predicted nucleic acid-binding protein
MIHLDTNYLVGAVNPNSPVPSRLRGWLQQGESLAASSIAWAEFLNGPVTDRQVHRMDGVIEGRVVAFGRAEAELASRLFNRKGRRRGSRPDCFIAAAAICARAPLATENRRDFLSFAADGLRLA